MDICGIMASSCIFSSRRQGKNESENIMRKHITYKSPHMYKAMQKEKLAINIMKTFNNQRLWLLFGLYHYLVPVTKNLSGCF